VVVVSRGDGDASPAGFLNLREDPKVVVKLGPKPPALTIAEIADSDERARIWPIMNAKHRNDAGSQRKTKREIPLVLPRPAES
jgi:hypothetical protein